MDGISVTLTTSNGCPANPETSELLESAATVFEAEYSLRAELTHSKSQSDERAGDLLTAVNVALTAISTLVAVLTYLRSRSPEIRYRIRRGNREIDIDRSEPDDELEKRLTQWAETPSSEERDFTVEIEL